ncbi:MAG: class I SAM-dependent methyltransferase [Bacteroidales bacterium]|nr:class I SAM-dependent methyltransferase [Bacteroidales bacterium]
MDISDEDDTYPFAGYKKVLAGIYEAIRLGQGKRVLDIGFGTGVLAGMLYKNGYEITGIDFSERMIQIAQEKMPSARLIHHDFSKGLPAELADSKYDAIICTYAIHHLDDAAKTKFLKELQTHLNIAGKIYIGDVAFCTREELNACRESCGDEWDGDEFYIVAEEVSREIVGVQFEKVSYCAGILSLDGAVSIGKE